MRSRFVRSLPFLLALLLATSLQALAQATGTIAGTVRDVGSGSPVIGARVEALAASGQVAGAATTDASGRYRIGGLQPGNYVVVISSAVFETRRLEAQVSAGGEATVNLSFSSGNVQLDPLVISASKRPEKALEAPARVEVVSEREIEARPATTPVDHLRNIAGVDIASTGVQSGNVVARGFNNIFSGSLHALTDYRIAGVPSLRVNFLHFVPANNEDIQRMEVVLGPGAALYGPNTANGILHILTKSPLDEQGTTVAFGGGSQSALQGEFRTAHLIGENFGFKLSGQYLRAEEWRYVDPAEVAEQERFRCAISASGCTAPQVAAARFARDDLARAVGVDSIAANERIRRIGQRDYDMERWGAEARVDANLSEDVTAVFSAGTTTEVNGIELTGLGAGQARDWTYRYAQARATWNRLFGQIYVNKSDAGETFLLRNGAPIVDRSTILVGQLQHGMDFREGRQRFTYGADYVLTTPVTEGTINGAYEGFDRTREFGAYLQSETAISPQLDLVLAGRIDFHSALPDPVFSPRAALVYKPKEGHALRVSYNRAFTTPSSLNQFLDLGSGLPGSDASTTALRQLGYSLRIQGTGDVGFNFRQPDGSYLVRSPFTPSALGGPGALLPGTSTALFPLAVGVVAQRAALAGTPLPASLVTYLLGLRPTAAQVGLNYLDLVQGGAPASLAGLALDDIDPIRESISNTFEAGYKGILANRLLFAADVWWSRREGLVTPLTIQTPLVLLNGPQTVGYLIPRFMADLGMSQAQAQALALQLVGSPTAPGLATIPVGVISSADVNANGGQILVTYVNVDETLDLWGSDVSATLIFRPEWSLTASGSFVNEDHWNTASAGLVTLNAPTRKATLALTYDDSDDTGVRAEVRGRYTNGFPVNSGVYIGTLCLNQANPSPLAEACVKDYTLMDLNVGYRLPFGRRNTTLQVNITNLLDAGYRPFPGVPTIGRMILARVKYDF